MARSTRRTRPKEIFYDGQVNITWYDGTITKYNYFDLRCACVCASCVDEFTGEKILDDSKVSPDIYPKDSEYVGNYALRIRWSDGHDHGLYTFERLRDHYPKASEEKIS